MVGKVVTFQPGGPCSIPGGLGILISLVLGVCVCVCVRVCVCVCVCVCARALYSAMCCLWRWPCHSANHRFHGGQSLCICVVFWPKVCASLIDI